MLARLKMKIDPPVTEMLDQLPNELWTSEDKTFLDPAMGGGQFVAAIEQRLRDYGHSDANIAGRVYGFEENVMRIRYAQRVHGLVGKYSATNFLEDDVVKKFDVIVGNPPYQDSGSTSGNKLYTSIIEKSFEILEKDGYLAFITPTGWMSYADNKSKRTSFSDGSAYKNIFRDNQIVWLNCRTINSYFPSVGSSFSAYVLKKSQVSNETSLVTSNNKIEKVRLKNWLFYPKSMNYLSLSIFEKTFFSNKSKININQSNEKHATPFNKSIPAPSREKSTKNKYELFHTNVSSRWSDTKHSCHDLKKVLLSISGYIKPIFDNGEKGVTHIGLWIPVTDRSEGERLIAILQSKLYQYLIDETHYSGFHLTKVLKMLPAVDLSISWTDKELYDHFGLTQEERDYIESYFAERN